MTNIGLFLPQNVISRPNYVPNRPVLGLALPNPCTVFIDPPASIRSTLEAENIRASEASASSATISLAIPLDGTTSSSPPASMSVPSSSKSGDSKEDGPSHSRKLISGLDGGSSNDINKSASDVQHSAAPLSTDSTWLEVLDESNLPEAFSEHLDDITTEIVSDSSDVIQGTTRGKETEYV